MNRTFGGEAETSEGFLGGDSSERCISLQRDGYAYQKEGGKTLKLVARCRNSCSKFFRNLVAGFADSGIGISCLIL